MANLSSRREILDSVYQEAPTTQNDKGVRPSVVVDANGVKLELPTLLAQLEPLDKVIQVDYYIPGCPPTPDVTWNALETILSGKLPKRGCPLIPSGTR